MDVRLDGMVTRLDLLLADIESSRFCASALPAHQPSQQVVPDPQPLSRGIIV